MSVSQRQEKICITELISGKLHRFLSCNVYGNGIESIWRDITNAYEIYYMDYNRDKVFSGIFI